MNLYYIIYLLFRIIAIFLTVTIFEFTKALTSTLMGDKMPKNDGRLTLNPFKHFEPIGFLLFFFTGYGWGQPVRTSALYYKDRKKDTLVTYIAPMVVCCIIGVVLNFVSKFLGENLVVDFISVCSMYFVRIAVFNIIPVAPMSGSKILSCFLEPTAALRYSQNEKIIQMVFLFLWFFGIIPPILNAIVAVFYIF